MVKSHLDCSSATDTKLGFDSSQKDTSDPDKVTFPSISLYDISDPDPATHLLAEVGDYKVCFSLDGAKYDQIPSSAGEPYLEIEALEGDSSEPVGAVYTYQMLSGKAGEKNTFVLAGSKLYLPSDSGLGFSADKACTYLNFSATVDVEESTGDGYVFTGDVPDLPPGDYTMCYCDDQISTGVASPGESKYTVTQDRVCTDELNALTYGSLSAEARDDLCTVKCAQGCTGADCFCDFFDSADYVANPDSGTSYPLCVSAAECKEICSDHAQCTGFSYDRATTTCTLTASNTCMTQLSLKEGSEFWARTADTAVCSTDDEYDKVVGTVTLTARVDVGVDWVLTPGEPSSVEVLGSGLDWKTDRLMVIDCTGICGVSGPTASVMAGPKSQMHYNHWTAVSTPYTDSPHDDTEAPAPMPPLTPAAALLWGEVEDSYCAGNNMDVASIAGVNRHQCYAKCVKGCKGDDCFCDGLMQGYDGPDSQALCLDEDTCKSVCDARRLLRRGHAQREEPLLPQLRGEGPGRHFLLCGVLGGRQAHDFRSRRNRRDLRFHLQERAAGHGRRGPDARVAASRRSGRVLAGDPPLRQHHLRDWRQV
jgi:hypothetical protein